MTTLLIYLDPARAGPEVSYPWALRASSGAVLREGLDPIGAMAEAEQCVLVLPYHRIAVHRAILPPGGREKLQGALGFAIEDSLIGDAGAVYAALAGDMGAGAAAVVAADRRVLESALNELRTLGKEPAKLIAEPLAAPLPAGAWSVVLDEAGGFVRSAAHAAFSLDSATQDGPPIQIRLALAQAREAGSAPQKLSVHGPAGAASTWGAALDIGIEEAGPWGWQQAAVATSPDLLQGDLRRTRSRLESLRPWVPAAALALGLVVVYAGFMLARWGSLSWERASLAREMEVIFRQAVPDAQAIVDPPLQMRRVLAGLRRASGALVGQDFLALLSRAAPEIARVKGSNVRVIDYAAGVLRIELALPRAEDASQIVARLGEGGERAVLESSSASGSTVIARIAIGEPSR